MFDAFQYAAALTGGYIFLNAMIIYAVSQAKRPLLMHIYRIVIGLVILIFALLLIIRVFILQDYEHTVIFISLLIGNIYVFPRKK